MKKIVFNTLFVTGWCVLLYGVTTVLFSKGSGVVQQSVFGALGVGMFGLAFIKEGMMRARV